MRSAKTVMSVLVVGILVAACLPSAKADASDWDTFITFSAPVEIPGMALAPGKYEFRVLDNTGSGYLVTVLDSEGHYLEEIQAESAYRSNLTDKTVVKLEKINPKLPEALELWFYPDENYGVKFVYPKPTATTR